MNATVADLQKGARELIREVVQHGGEIILTEFGQPVAKLVPYIRTVTVSPDAARRAGALTDESILAALQETREKTADHLEPR